MTTITIRQTGDLSVAPNAEVSFAGEPGFPVTVEAPFSAAEEAQLAWYFETWLNFPFTDGVKAAAAAVSVRRYGETLFRQLFRADERAYRRYQQALAQGVATLQIQVIGDPSFHGLHWEALWDPARPRPFVLDAALIRSGIEVLTQRLTGKESPTINLLLVTARPHGGRDVSYRTIQRPLVEMLHQSQLPVQVDLVRPGTWRALVDHLRGTQQRHGVGHYQIIHFDLHGAVLPKAALTAVAGVSAHTFKVRLEERYARPNLTAPDPFADRPTAWLFFEDETGDDLDAASAQEVADLLLDHQIGIAILNACQSGQETGDAETSLGSRLLQAGVQTVVAMSYAVTVSGATAFMRALPPTLPAAPRSADRDRGGTHRVTPRKGAQGRLQPADRSRRLAAARRLPAQQPTGAHLAAADDGF